MEALHKFRNVLDKIVGTICVLLFALMVVVGTYQIVTRFVFNNPSTIYGVLNVIDLCKGYEKKEEEEK